MVLAVNENGQAIIADDLLLSFHTCGGAVRGRLARLGPAIDTIIAGHDYPPAIGGLLAETLALAATLAGALKYDGIFTLQAQGNGPVSLLVADVSSDGALRGYARFDAERLAQTSVATATDLLGSGYLAFTVDQGADTDRYQGIVELTGATLAECVEEYFRRSEQLDTALKAAIRAPTGDKGWRATALMVQRMPGDMAGQPILIGDEAEDVWRRAVALARSATESEMIDEALSGESLLWRLYHAETLTTFAPHPLAARCRCSPEKVADALRAIPHAEIGDLLDETGHVVVTCEFCTKAYAFRPDELGNPG
jgi:molecular chaperone Hsp33